MHFYLATGDGDGRLADTLRFVDSRGATHTVAATYAGVTVVAANGAHNVTLTTVDEVGPEIARLLVLCRDQSLVVHSSTGRTLRGDETSTADVHPPHRHPRIKVKP